MFTPPEITTLRFTEDGTQTQSAIAATVSGLLRSHRANPQLRIFLAADGLQTKTIATLISALRKMREVGGAIELTADNEAVRRIIQLHGLESVFKLPPIQNATGAQWHARGGIAKAVSGAIAAIAVLMGPSPDPLREHFWMIW